MITRRNSCKVSLNLRIDVFFRKKTFFHPLYSGFHEYRHLAAGNDVCGKAKDGPAPMGVSELWSRGFALFPEAGAGEEEDATDGAATRGASHGTDGGERGGRPRWGSTAEFVLAAIGSAVGLGNLLRFPYMVYKHGGCAFLVPYALAVVFLGVPILAMELALGQVAQSGCVDALAAMHARAWGIGAAATAGAFLLASYYCAVLAWAWCFLAATWQPTMPWSDGRAAAFFVDDVLARWDSRDGTASSHDRGERGERARRIRRRGRRRRRVRTKRPRPDELVARAGTHADVGDVLPLRQEGRGERGQGGVDHRPVALRRVARLIRQGRLPYRGSRRWGSRVPRDDRRQHAR